MRSFQVLLLVLGGLILPAAGGVAYWGYRTSPEQTLRRGLAQLDQGLAEEAAAIAQSLDERGHPEPACLLRGEIWRRSGLALASTPAAENSSEALLSPRARDAFQRALAEFSRIKARDPLAVDSQVVGAECLVRLGERRLATEVLLAVVSRKPEHKEAHRWLAAIYIDLNSADRAIEHLRAWGELEPANGRPYRWIGLFYKDAKRPDEAIAAYQEALRRDLEPALRAAVVGEYAQSLMEFRGDYQEPLHLLAKLPDEQREQPNLRMIEAQCLFGQGRKAEAISAVDKVLQAMPDSVLALRFRAKIHLADDQPQPALPLLEKAVRLDPNDVETRQQLMHVYRQLGDTARADKEQRRLEETKNIWDQLTKLHEKAWRSPWDDQVRCRLAELCLKVNKPAEARMWLTAALACNPENQRAHELLQQMRSER